ncbi:MAG: hypothetical protein ACMUHY_02380 [Thermoplasmatota archaeon]
MVLGLLSASILLMIMLFSLPANAESSEYKALIIVSDYEGTDQHELDKAVAFHDHLINKGFSEDEILFITSEDIDCRDQAVTVDNIENGFEWVIDNSKRKTEVNIYISDNSHIIDTESFYQFTDGQVNCSDIIDWIDQISYETLNYITLGNHSGLFGAKLVGPERVIISSMRECEESAVDRFNITRSLEDPAADIDHDGVVSFVEAFCNEKMLLIGTGQNPVLWCP